MLSAISRFKSYDPTRGSFSTWLGAIARNEAIDIRQKLRRQPRIMPNDEATETILGLATAKESEGVVQVEMEWLRYAVPDSYLSALRLVVFEGHSSEEAAKQLGATPGTIRTYVWRARKALRAAMEVSA